MQRANLSDSVCDCDCDWIELAPAPADTLDEGATFEPQAAITSEAPSAAGAARQLGPTRSTP